jgi:hypothetical protein
VLTLVYSAGAQDAGIGTKCAPCLIAGRQQ